LASTISQAGVVALSLVEELIYLPVVAISAISFVFVRKKEELFLSGKGKIALVFASKQEHSHVSSEALASHNRESTL